VSEYESGFDQRHPYRLGRWAGPDDQNPARLALLARINCGTIPAAGIDQSLEERVTLVAFSWLGTVHEHSGSK
jgi:hypothetical protein